MPAMRDVDPSDSELRPALGLDEQSSNGTAPDGSSAAAGPAEDAPDFLTQLAQAMQATAGTERARAIADIDRRRAAHVALIQSRRDAEIARMRELAADDRTGIDAWAEAEQRRIQAERERRTKELEADLRRSLEEHGPQVDRQIAAAETAVTAHRAEVDRFFASLGTETDPVRIAQLAAQRPAFPDLEAASAAANPTSEPTDATASEPPSTTTPPTPAKANTKATPSDAAAQSTKATSKASPSVARSVVDPQPAAEGAAPPETQTRAAAVREAFAAASAQGSAPKPDRGASASAGEPPVVGVMDPITRLGLLMSSNDESSPAEPELLAPTPALAASLAGNRKPPVVTPLAARTSSRRPEPADPPPSTSLNPMSWLRRGNDRNSDR
jgi:hypothetical protein